MTDSLQFLAAVAGLPEQLSNACETAQRVDAAAWADGHSIDNVVVLGMGGSGISGDVLSAVAATVVSVPITVVKNYDIPAFVGPGTLAFAMSYSGGTEETVSMARAAALAGARIVAISTGGALQALASDHGGLHVQCPEGYMPRAAVGALVAPMLVVLHQLGFLPDALVWLTDAHAQLAVRRDLCVPEITSDTNQARALASKIGRTFPLVYGGGPLGAVAAMRWKCDINENAKAPAFWNTYPELDHNEICGWAQHGDVTRQLITIVELRHSFEHPQVERRFSATREIIRETVHAIVEVRAGGASPLAQLLDLMYLGDWVSCYLALDNDVDPGPIDAIATLKAALAGGA